MENDHLEDAIRFVEGALESSVRGTGNVEWQLSRALEELRLEMASRTDEGTRMAQPKLMI